MCRKFLRQHWGWFGAGRAKPNEEALMSKFVVVVFPDEAKAYEGLRAFKA